MNDGVHPLNKKRIPSSLKDWLITTANDVWEQDEAINRDRITSAGEHMVVANIPAKQLETR